jgi:NAD(P)-dependent dehydrogenase (short-subunit alcohol dehydrogenase family)
MSDLPIIASRGGRGCLSARRRVKGGSLLHIGGAGGRRIRSGLTIVSAIAAAIPASTGGLALELAPIRVNLIAPGFVDTPLSASLLGDDLDKRREELRATLPIGRVVGPVDVAALAVHLVINMASRARRTTSTADNSSSRERIHVPGTADHDDVLVRSHRRNVPGPERGPLNPRSCCGARVTAG